MDTDVDSFPVLPKTEAKELKISDCKHADRPALFPVHSQLQCFFQIFCTALQQTFCRPFAFRQQYDIIRIANARYAPSVVLPVDSERYQAFCKRHHYIFQADKPEKLFNASKELVAVFHKEKTYKLLIQQSIQQLKLASAHVERLRREMNELAATLPEYDTVMGIYGVGKTYGPQLIAEIGDVSRFTHREALTAFAGVDPGVDESGQHKSKSNRASKVGSARLRKTLFQIMTTLLQNAPEDDPVYRFLDKKRSQGKPYYVYMTAGANKFLRIYYGKVKECLRNLEQES